LKQYCFTQQLWQAETQPVHRQQCHNTEHDLVQVQVLSFLNQALSPEITPGYAGYPIGLQRRTLVLPVADLFTGMMAKAQNKQ